MLVLTRKLGESIQIGDQVMIEVLEVRGGRVRLGITAPRDIEVQRSELVFDSNPVMASRPAISTAQSSAQRGRIALASGS